MSLERHFAHGEVPLYDCQVTLCECQVSFSWSTHVVCAPGKMCSVAVNGYFGCSDVSLLPELWAVPCRIAQAYKQTEIGGCV